MRSTAVAPATRCRCRACRSPGSHCIAAISVKVSQREKLEHALRREAPGRYGAAVADRGRAGSLCVEDTVSGRHDARDLPGTAGAGSIALITSARCEPPALSCRNGRVLLCACFGPLIRTIRWLDRVGMVQGVVERDRSQFSSDPATAQGNGCIRAVVIERAIVQAPVFD